MKGLPRSLARGNPLASPIIKQTLAVRAAAISVAGTTGVGFGSAVVGDFPEGNILFLGAVVNMQFSGSGSDANLAATWSGDFALGTTPASDGTISAGDEDLVAETALAAASVEVSPLTRASSTSTLSGAILNNTDGSLEINLNLLIDDADIGGTVPITATGEIYLSYVMLGDD